MIRRRRFLQALSALGMAAVSPARAQHFNPKPSFLANPFSLGVASGYPRPTTVTLWTRLAPVPDAPGGGMPPEIIPVSWELARDEGMKDIAASGTAYATPEWGHSVHVDPFPLQANRPYWYRFRAGDVQSPVGHTRTAPGVGAKPTQLRFAFASCQHFEQGYFAAYRHMLADQPDLILHMGDYIYESSWGRDPVRRHNTPETITLDDYRARYALYKSDQDLQAAHAAVPWALIWDDHEVENDYASERSQSLDHPEWFLARRAAAYKAWYEHMPAPRFMVPVGPHARIHARLIYGNLASFHLLDDRQYRSLQVCTRPGRGGSNTVDVAECPEIADAARTLLGKAQEQWLEGGLSASRTRWNVIAQQTQMAQLDQKPGAGRSAWTDAWDGYPAARRRLLEFMSSAKVSNPVVVGGDVHAFVVSQLKPDFDDPASPVVASEFVGTSITSQGSAGWLDKALPENPHIVLGEGRHRGYVRVELSQKQCRADLRVLESEKRRDTPCSTLASFVVEDGKPGPVKAA